MVQVGSSEEEWQNIDKATSTLDGKVPYIVVPGNHDLDRIQAGRRTVLFNRFFPVGRFEKIKGFGGSFPIGSNDNSFHTFHFIIMGIARLPRAIDNSNSANWLRTSQNRQGIRGFAIDQ